MECQITAAHGESVRLASEQKASKESGYDRQGMGAQEPMARNVRRWMIDEAKFAGCMEGRSVETTVFSIMAGSLATGDVGRNC